MEGSKILKPILFLQFICPMVKWFPTSCTRNHPELPGMAQNYPVLSGIAPNCPESPGITQNRPELPEMSRITRNHQEMPGITRNVRNHPESPEFPEIPRNWPESPGIAWNLLELPGIGRNRPELHRFACNCFAQLCSAVSSRPWSALVARTLHMQQNKAHVRGALAQSLTFVLVYTVILARKVYLHTPVQKRNWFKKKFPRKVG